MITLIHNSKLWSLRVSLPIFLLLFAIGGGVILYFIEMRIHEAKFETNFHRNQMLEATRIQSDVERWVLRNDMEMVQLIFSELGVDPNMKTSMFLDSSNIVLAATRREYIGQTMNVASLGLDRPNQNELISVMQNARRTMRGRSLFTSDRNGMIVFLPTLLPLRLGDLRAHPGGMILVVYDLRMEKASNHSLIEADFFNYFTSIIIIALALGISMHFLITRRLAHLQLAMSDFACGKAVVKYPSKLGDEISLLVMRFNDMATTIRKTMEETQDLYDHAPCGYHSLDASGVFVRINDTELSWLGYSRDEIIGKVKFQELLTPQGLDLFLREFPGFKERGWINNLDFEVVCKNGTILPVVLNATTVKDANGNYVMSRSVMHDVTERKKAEEEIHKLNQELEKRVAERTARLEAANKELESLAYSLAHDLRTPLRAIDGFSQLFFEEYYKKVDAQGKDYLQRTRSAIQRIGQIIDDMLDLSQISRSEINIKHVNLSKMVKEIADNFQASQPERNVKFIIHEKVKVLADSRLLRTVLENLIGNAWKFTSKHPTALIEFGVQKQKGLPVYFISDDGAGFDMNYAQRLFGAFQRLHTINEFEGNGIGLATVQRIIHRHGGKVWAEGEIEKGATFYFTIP